MAVTIGLFFSNSSLAIAVDDYAAAEVSPTNSGYGLNWDYIYKYKGASSVAVDHYWILTAGHVADDSGAGSLTVGGETYTQQEIVYHPSADLALVRYDKRFPGYYLLHEGEIHDGRSGPRRLYYELVMVGFGFDGTVSSSSFTQGSSRKMRWGTNRGEAETTITVNMGGLVGEATSECFRVDFGLNDTAYEAGANVYDSGGPYFIEDGSSWKLTGINTLRTGSGSTYTGNYAVKTPVYVSWIKSVIADYDSDMDGLPDHWEQSTGETEAGLDPDDDGFTNFDEWIADTDPNSGNSYLQLMAYTNSSILAFSSSDTRSYLIEYTSNLTNQNWQTEIDWFTGTSPATIQPVSTVESNRIYRVRVKLP